MLINADNISATVSVHRHKMTQVCIVPSIMQFEFVGQCCCVRFSRNLKHNRHTHIYIHNTCIYIYIHRYVYICVQIPIHLFRYRYIDTKYTIYNTYSMEYSGFFWVATNPFTNPKERTRSISLIARVMERVIAEGSTVVMKARGAELLIPMTHRFQ